MEPTKKLNVLGQDGKFVSQSQNEAVCIFLPTIVNLK